MRFPFIISALFLLICSPLLAQDDFRPGYVILSSGDSLTGLISYRNSKGNERLCTFKSTRHGKKQRLDVNQVRAYGVYGDKRYESRVLPLKDSVKKRVFAESIVKGTLSLYKHRKVFYILKGDSVIQLPQKGKKRIDDDGIKYIVISRRYVGLLNILVADCHLSADRTQYNDRSMALLITNYNRCKNEPGDYNPREKPWWQIKGLVFAGFEHTTWNIQNTLPSKAPIFGAGFEFSLPRVFDKVFFVAEAWVVQKRFYGYSERTLQPGIQRIDVQTDLSSLKFPIGFRYNFSAEGQTVYIKAGAAQYFNLKSTQDVLIEEEVSGVITTTHTVEKVQSPNGTAFWAGLGFVRKVSGHIQLFAEVRVESGGYAVGEWYDILPNKISNLTGMVGFRF